MRGRRSAGAVVAAVLAGVAVLACAAAPARAQDSIRCDSRLASRGDLDIALRQTCGEPYFIDSWQELVSVEAAPDVAIATPVQVEDWYYDQGSNRFLQRVRLRDGRIVAVDSLPSYGRRRPLETCRGAAVRTGISVGELVSLCGQPGQRRALGQALLIGQPPATSVLPTRHERWIYPLAERRWLLVELQQGRVRALQASSDPG